MIYRKYRFTYQEWVICILKALGITAVIAYLFYQSVFGLVVITIVLPLCVKETKASKSRQRRDKLDIEFKECIHAAAGALLAGYSVENAFCQARIEMLKLYGEEAMIVKELEQMEIRLGRNEAIETILQDFSNRSGSDEIESFTEVFSFAKRGGGDFVQIIQTTVDRIGDKIEVGQEIQAVLAAKEMEQKVMSIIPLGVLLFFQLSSPDFLQSLYGSGFGALIMTAALLVYAAAMKISAKIVDIEV